jgi:hypothetical protein
MALSLYDLSVPTFPRTVSAVAGFLDRAATHCAEDAVAAYDILGTRGVPLGKRDCEGRLRTRPA